MGTVGGPRHYAGRGLGDTVAGGPVEWICPSCRTAQISVQANGCPSCGAGTKEQAEVAAAQQHAALHPPDAIARIVFGVAEAGGAELGAWAQCLRAPAQLTLCRALAHYAETGGIGPGELSRREVVSWARAVMPAEEERHAADLHHP